MRLSRRTVMDVGLLVLVNTMWAAQYAAYKIVAEKMGPVTVSVWTFLIGSLVLLPFLFWERGQAGHSPAAAPAPGTPGAVDRSPWSPRNALGLLVAGVLGLIPASAFVAWGVDRSTASNAAIIYLTVPIITALMASVMLKERMTLVRWGSLFVALAGVLILSGFDWRHLQLTNSKFLFGNLLVLLACSSSSFYNVACKGLLRRFRPVEVLVYTYAIAFVVSLPVLQWAEPQWLAGIRSYRPATWVALVVLSVFSWGLAMVLWFFLLKRLDVSQASVSVYLLPFLGVVISAVTLKEHITATMLIGGGVTLAGTLLITSLEPTSE